ncbi:putative galactose oxidase [Helianthus annuus]|nr:putative galactose oxidase [Helianthus annuus]KAJ0634480.1 putative galactose oxidase [Helianthus annuus]KAJ0720484.1 putative galactose oxidase [Helianthus annuus]KAJ0723687.1 putative galactose oxidase [Helianthus annuus]KAJ0903108.1 putative galactose oxidase [Helianthus annuus]
MVSLSPHLIIFFFILLATASYPTTAGSWSLLQPTIGISAMHMQLLPTDRVIIFDRTDFGASNISLPDGKCREDQNDYVLKKDCSAHSVEYDVTSNSIRPLMVLTDVWCSSGALTPDGSLVQTGGFNDGDHVIRVFNNSCVNCDWEEIESGLVNRRWYASNHILPDGRQIVIGGRRQYNYEFYPKTTSSDKAYSLPFLVQTNDLNVENNLYPFVFLNTDGNLFIFANNRAILFDYDRNKALRTFPEIPGGEPRNYPSTGSAVLLPMRVVQGNVAVVEVLVCGCAPKGAFVNAQNKKFDGALNSCGRIRISDPDPKWVMEIMPMGRVMSDMVLLPNGDVLIVNGGSNGTAGWEYGRNPVLNPLIYRPYNPVSKRFDVENPSTIPRMYHSTAVLLRDGRVLVGGSNPHVYYNFTNVLFPTELSLEAFSPSYLDPSSSGIRPKIISPATQTKIQYGKQIVVRFMIQNHVDLNLISVTLIAPSFNTHSFSMNQRLLVLDGANTIKSVGKMTYEVNTTTPSSGNVAPAGYYMLFVVHQEIPSEGIWVVIH